MTTGGEIREARSLLCWTRSEFSRLTALPIRVLDRAEATDEEPSITRGQLIAIRHALAKAGVEFASDPPRVRLRAVDAA